MRSMFKALALSASAALAALPATAQVTAAQTAELCQASWDRLAAALPLSAETGAAPAEDGRCSIERVALETGYGLHPAGFEASRMLWATEGYDPADPAALPRALSVEIEGINQLLHTGDPVFDYLLRFQMRASSTQARMDLHWDEAEQRLELERLEIDFPGQNSLSLSATLAGIDLGSVGMAQISAMSSGLARLDLEIETNGLFESLALIPLGNALIDPWGAEPAEQVAQFKAAAAGWLSDLPEANLDGASRTALLDLLDTLPNPAGTLRIRAGAEPPFGPSRFMGAALFGLAAPGGGGEQLLEGVRLSFDWQPTER